MTVACMARSAKKPNSSSDSGSLRRWATTSSVGGSTGRIIRFARRFPRVTSGSPRASTKATSLGRCFRRCMRPAMRFTSRASVPRWKARPLEKGHRPPRTKASPAYGKTSSPPAGDSGGLFESHPIGTVLSAPVYAAALQAHPQIPSEIEAGEFPTLHAWLKDHLYLHGRKFLPNEMIERTAGKLSVRPYLAYLRAKYGE